MEDKEMVGEYQKSLQTWKAKRAPEISSPVKGQKLEQSISSLFG